MRRKLASLSVAFLILAMAWTNGGALSLDSFISIAVSDPVTDDVIFQLRDQIDEVAATGAYFFAANLTVRDLEATYDFRLLALEVIDNGLAEVGTCGAADFRIYDTVNEVSSDLFDGLSVPITPDGEPFYTDFDLQLSIPSTGTTADCVWSGGVVRATLQDLNND